MIGRVHSIESFGTVDGPGVRLVVFLQGCPMRCLYCHNPDTWDMQGGTEMTPEQILQQYEKNRSFYRKGGITVTGGEPLMQMEFVTELFTLASKKGIHTCLDTSGITFRPEMENQRARFDRLMAVTDLVLLDLKHIDPEVHQKLTGHSLAPVLAFARYLDEKRIPVWVRHVVVPGISDDENALTKLGRFIGTLRNVQVIDALPYHNMGVSKYEKLGLDYPLKGIPPVDAATAHAAREQILNGWKEVRSHA